MKRFLEFLIGAAALAIASQASATTTWVLTTGSVTQDSAQVTSTGWANTGSGATADAQLLQAQVAGANMFLYGGGLGINNLNGCSSGSTCDVGDLQSTAPEHAIDNNQRYEMVLLSFNKLVNLTGVTSKWTGSDADVTVMAYTGGGDPSTSFTSKNWGGLNTASGWNVIANVGNLTNCVGYSNASNGCANAAASTSTSGSWSTSTYSSYWLIGAFNPLVNNNTNTSTALSAASDYFKLYSVSGCVQGATGAAGTDCGGGVPEPASIALSWS